MREMEVWLQDGFFSLIHLENRDGAPDRNRQFRRGACSRQGKNRCSVYTRTCGICLCSKHVFAEKIKGGATSLERDLVAYGNKRERKDSLKISGTICIQKWLNCFKISLTRCRNVFDKSFHHRYSKGKCHPNPHGITMNYKYIRPPKSANQSCFTIFQKSFFFLMVLVTLKVNIMLIPYYEKEKYLWNSLRVIFLLAKSYTGFLMLSFSKPILVSGSILFSSKLFFMMSNTC